MNTARVLIAFGVLVIGLPLFADSPFTNIKEIQKSFGFEPYYEVSTRKLGRLRVAILDKDFTGYEKEIGKTLPKSVEYHPGPIEPPEAQGVPHGLYMAQIFSALATDEGRWNPDIELHLYNVFGFSNFEAAIDDLKAKKIDVVLYSEVWEYGGNFDGKGFINAAVSRAIDAGVIWINAAGNFAEHTYNGEINVGEENWLELPDRNKALELKCAPQGEAKTCSLRAVLSWNDFKDTTGPGTDKDLDLALTDDLLNILETAALSQSADEDEARPGYSKYPREILMAQELKEGTYYLRVKDRSKNFSSSDRLRITVNSEHVELTSFDSSESLLNPADHPEVITVGAYDSEKSSQSVSLGKPDILASSRIVLKKDDAEFLGSSNSAAIVAAGVSLMKLNGYNDLTREEIIEAFGSTTGDGSGGGYPPGPGGSGGFGPTGPNCYLRVYYNNLPPAVLQMMNSGAQLVETTGGPKLLVAPQMSYLFPILNSLRQGEKAFVGPQGFFVQTPGYTQPPYGYIELIQANTPICH